MFVNANGREQECQTPLTLTGMIADDRWFGAPQRMVGGARTEAHAIPGFAALIGADPWTLRRIVAVVLALTLATEGERWIRGLLNGFVELEVQIWLATLGRMAVRVGVAVAVLRRTKREIPAAIVAGIVVAIISVVTYRETDYGMFEYRWKSAFAVFVSSAAWIAIPSFLLRRIRVLFFAIFVSELAQLVVRFTTFDFLYGGGLGLYGLEPRTLIAAFVTAAFVSIAVRFTPADDAEPVRITSFGVPSSLT